MMDQAHQISILTPVEQYAKDLVANAQQQTEDAFLYGKLGQEFLGLQSRTEATTEAVNHWFYNGNVGNNPGQIGSGKPEAIYKFAAGDTATLTAQGPVNAWANIYFYMRLPMPSSLPRRLVDSRTFLIQDLSGWQALEFQSQLTLGGLTYNLAWQANINSKVWRYFDYTNTKWKDIGITVFDMAPFPDFTKPVTIAAEFALDGQSTTHVALTINGQRYPVEIKQQATPTKNADKFTTAVQIDPKPGATCSLQILQHDVRFL